ncbi:hypothetical protein OLX02_03835 [Novosphingobium sp. KCTC 2891]|uniref:hypothetical protein n=1 Tax=Novosphingobium sp. KCTC 2891 TaxID=2989730 RepID=UPI002221722A|nr:hypothetical protein [Novosphingobium sp. KCTC 2891]MCW1381945.1 hypothetical protein [Novosphingobium sp. KCTC 2891]
MVAGRQAPRWWDSLKLRSAPQPSDLQAVADFCEALEPDRQRAGFERALRLFGAAPLLPAPHEEDTRRDDLLWINLLADSGAYESAAVALLPDAAVYTCGRLNDGTFIAQVVLGSGTGAHSRSARSLAMALVAAVLRAMARDIVELRALQ